MEAARAEARSQPSRRRNEDSVEIFRKSLTSQWTRKKTPYGLDAALAQAAGSTPESTDRIFLNAGFAAWLSYFLTTNGEGHYEGRRAQREGVAAFRQLSIEEQILVAEEVAKIVPHATVEDAIDKMLQDPKRRRLLSPTSNRESQEPSTPTRPTSFSATSLLSLTQLDTPPNSEPPGNDIDPGLSIQQQTLSHASLQETADVFPEYISGAIRRDATEDDGKTYWTAAVTMNFPHVGKVDCLMSLAIKETKVEYIAMALFNVHVEVEPAVQARQVVLQHGVRLVPNPDITLQGVQDEAIMNLFGPEIYTAVRASRVYQEEVQQGLRVTRCVSMTIPSDPKVGAIINLNLGLKEGSRVRDKLYRGLVDKGTLYS